MWAPCYETVSAKTMPATVFGAPKRRPRGNTKRKFWKRAGVEGAKETKRCRILQGCASYLSKLRPCRSTSGIRIARRFAPLSSEALGRDRGRQLENLSFVYFLLWLILFRGAAFWHVSLVLSGRRFAIFLWEMLRSDRLSIQEGLGGEFTSPVVAPERLFTSLRRYSK